MKYSFKDYLIDTLMLGLSVSITPIVYLLTLLIENKFDYHYIISPIYLYLAIFISFLLPFIFGAFLSRKICKQSIYLYLTVFVITEIISILHITMPDTYFMFFFTNEMWVRSLFNNYNGIRDIIIACLVPVLYIVLYYLGSLLKYNKGK